MWVVFLNTYFWLLYCMICAYHIITYQTLKYWITYKISVALYFTRVLINLSVSRNLLFQSLSSCQIYQDYDGMEAFLELIIHNPYVPVFHCFLELSNILLPFLFIGILNVSLKKKHECLHLRGNNQGLSRCQNQKNIFAWCKLMKFL